MLVGRGIGSRTSIMTPIRWLQFLAVLLSTLSLTTETADDFNSTMSSQIQTHHHSPNNFADTKGIKDDMTELKENGDVLINNTENDQGEDSEPKTKFNFKFVDLIEERNSDLGMYDYSGLSKVKSHIDYEPELEDGTGEKKKRVVRSSVVKRNRTLAEMNELCKNFQMTKSLELYSPGYPENYKGNVECETVISAPDEGLGEWIIVMDFRDFFDLESHSNCKYDFLEIRDGSHGYDDPVSTWCGHDFPPQFRSQGPHLWIRFKSDATIEYRGFRAVFTFEKSPNSRKLINECSQNLEKTTGSDVNLDDEKYKKCKDKSKQRVDAIWTINVHESYNIFLNFTNFLLAYPNDCKKNFVEVFGVRTDMTGRLKQYCGTIAESLVHYGSLLHVRLVSELEGLDRMNFSFHYTAFRNSAKDNKPCKVQTKEEFDCSDMTCIDYKLICDNIADCRFKGDEDEELCQGVTESPLRQPNTLKILVVFSLLFSAMCLVMLYRCIRKLVSDNRIIKEHIREACEQRLDTIVGGKVKPSDTLRFQSDFLNLERASLQRDNVRNENDKRQRNKDMASKIKSKEPFKTHVDSGKDLWSLDLEDIAKFNMEEIPTQQTSKDKKEAKMRTKAKSNQEKYEKEIQSKNDEGDEEAIVKKGNRKAKIDKSETVYQIKKTDNKDFEDRVRKALKEGLGALDENRTRDKNVTDGDTTGQRGRKDASRRKKTEETHQDTGKTDAEDCGRRKVSICLPGTKETDCQTKESLFQDPKTTGRRPPSAETTKSAPDVIVFSSDL